MLPNYLARHIADEIYNADCSVRQIMLSGITNHNERSYMGALAHESARKLLALIGPRPITFRIDARDRNMHDGIFIFRYKNQIKIGVCEAKILRLRTPTGRLIRNLNSPWDSRQNGSVNSHFTEQVFKYRQWQPHCAVWCMFMLDLHIAGLAPFDPLGSDCIWLDDVYQHYNGVINDRTHLWSFNDLLSIPANHHTNLKSIIKDILVCKKGNIFQVDHEETSVSIEVDENEKSIPIPSIANNKNRRFQKEVQAFLESNDLDFYRYINFPELGGYASIV